MENFVQCSHIFSIHKMDILLFSLFILILLYCFYWYWTMPKNLPPGPISLPFVGSLLQLKFQSKDDVTTLEKWVKTYGPLYKFYIGRRLILVIADYDTIEQSLIKQGEVFSGRPIFDALYSQKLNGKRTGFLLTDGESWREQRRFALSTLKDCGMGKSSLQQSVAETAEVLLKELEAASSQGEPVDLSDPLNKAVSNVICSMAFGRTFDGEEFWRQLKLLNFRVSESGVSFLSPVVYFPWLKKLPVVKTRIEKYFQALDTNLDFVKKLIDQTKASYDVGSSDATTNYVHSFMKAKDDNCGKYFTESELLSSVSQLFTAGSDTTSTTLRFGIYYLSIHQDIQEKVFNEIAEKIGLENRILAWEDRLKLPYVEACLMEIQRISNLVPLSLMHRTMSPTKLCGYDIPADTLIVPFLGAVMSDPKYFPKPEIFDPERFLDENGNLKKHCAWIPFSAGDEAVLEDLLIFVKCGMKNLLREAVPYAAALSLETLNAYRKRNSAQVPGNHAFYLAVYEAKANRTSNETHVPVTENNGRKKPAEDEKGMYCSLYECYCGEVVTVRCSKCSAPLCDLCKPEKCSSFHHCKTYGSSAACLCGYDFDEQFLSM